MHYWFEEPYEAFVELSELYDKHIHDQMERRFIIVDDNTKIGLVELVDINPIHEFFINGKYHDVKRMYILQENYTAKYCSNSKKEHSSTLKHLI